MADLSGLERDAWRPRLDRAVDQLRTRGPDGQDVWMDERCGLGHTRLAIVDLSAAGAQPMTRGHLVITFNGLIYNFGRLREELSETGHRFESETDTEVLLAGWEQWGVALLPRLVGMFAFAIWDRRASTLYVARDRFGQKPLLYRHEGRRFSFASELRALQILEGHRGSVDHEALRHYMALRYLPEPWSILDGVNKLPPGHMMAFSAQGLEVRRWYDLSSERPAPFDDEHQAGAQLKHRLDEAVKDRLVADVPVGAFLSGGVDSAIVVASMARSATSVRSFTVGFDGVPDYYEEGPQARRVAEHLGTDHTEIRVSADETRTTLDAIFDGMDEPFADSSAIPTWLVARETRRHVTVALSGDGADEVFGGYRKYQGELQAARYQRLPGWLRRGVLEPVIRRLPESKSHPILESARRLRRFAAHAGGDAVSRHAGWARLVGEQDLDCLLGEPGSGTRPHSTVDSIVLALRAEARDDDPINAMLATDIALVLPGDMLVKVDRMSMAHALEVRCPFLDQRVVECAAAMPGHFKLRRGRGKHILRRAFADRLPAEVFARPKRGFEVPVAEWLTGPLRELTRRAIDPARLTRQGLFRPELPGRWFAELESGRRDTSWELWTLVAFQAWADRQAPDGLVT